jgi:signal peptidase II
MAADAGAGMMRMNRTRRLRLFGPLSWLGLTMAVLVFAADQLHKWWMLGPFDIAARQPVRVLPFLDLILTWNRGISYGWFNQPSEYGRWALLAVSLVVTWGLWLWLAHMRRPLGAAAVGLVIGGALGNAMDRLIHGAVADFFQFHAYGFHWYVFNIADAAIVSGVALLVIESLVDRKRPAY